MEIPLAISLITSAVSGFVSYRAAENNATAQEYAADAAEAQGEYNAQIDANNATQAVDQQIFVESQAESNKFRAIEEAGRKRKLLSSKLDNKLANQRISMSSFGTMEDVFSFANIEANNELAAFDFDTSASTYQSNLQAGEAGRKRNLAWDNGMAARDLTLASAANKATQFRNQADNTRLAGLGSAIGSVASMSNTYMTHTN